MGVASGVYYSLVCRVEKPQARGWTGSTATSASPRGGQSSPCPAVDTSTVRRASRPVRQKKKKNNPPQRRSLQATRTGSKQKFYCSKSPAIKQEYLAGGDWSRSARSGASLLWRCLSPQSSAASVDPAAVTWPSQIRSVGPLQSHDDLRKEEFGFCFFCFFLDETTGKGVFHGPDEAGSVTDGAPFKGLFTIFRVRTSR